MKKVLITILILGLIGLIGILNLEEKNVKSENLLLFYDKDEICNKLSEILKDWFIKSHSSDFHDIKINFHLEDFSITQDSKAEAIFQLHATMVPNSTINDIEEYPYIKGMKRFLEENRAKLSTSEIEVIEKEIKDYYNGLVYQISQLNEENGFYKITGNIESDGKIDKNSIEIYYDISGKGDHIWKSAENLFSSYISSDELEKEGYEYIKNFIYRLFPENNLENNSTKTHYNNYYNRYWAVNYLDHYTTEASENQYINCRHKNGTIEISYYTNINAWNNSQFPLPKWPDGKYKQLACYNCADYISQSMYNGGMWTDDYWNPSNRLTGAPDGKWYWTYVPDLKWWFWAERCDWYASTYNNTQSGDVIIWPNDEHIAMIDYSNNSTKKFAAHTNDRKQHPYSSTDPYQHFVVSCYREGPP